MSTSALLAVCSMPRLLGRLRPGRRTVVKMCLLLLVLTLGVAPMEGVPATHAADARAEVGAWQAPCSIPIIGVHAAVLSTGKVLLLTGETPLRTSPKGKAELWTPPRIGTQGCGTFVAKPPPTNHNIFCSGHSALANGTVLFAGGQTREFGYGVTEVSSFDPVRETWRERSPMAYKRWYPTSTTLSGGRILALSGSSEPQVTSDIPEIYNPGTNTWQALANAQRKLPLYPRMFVMPSGRVFYGGPGRDTRILNVGQQTWGAPIYTNYPNTRSQGTAVSYRPGRILILGGDDPATNTAEIINLNQSSPQWQYTSAMAYARRHANATLLPDGKVLVTGGTAAKNDKSAAVLAPELFDPTSGTWTTLASMQRPRIYHSTAVLLPDGRVVVAGTDGDKTLEIYSPPYLFKGSRPAIVSAPSTIAYGSSFEVTTDVNPSSIASIALIRLSVVTHSLNMDQRYVPLNFSVSAGKLSAQAPANGNLAPPGYYMLFIVDNQGRPSIAHLVRLHN